MKNIKILWLSANHFGLSLLKEALKLNQVKVVGIVTLSEKSRTRMYDGVDVAKWRKFKIPIFQIEDINQEAKLIQSLNPDLMIVCGWRQIINQRILNLLPRTVGFHPTLLPHGRGSAPIINALLHGWDSSGVTMFYLNEKVDSGRIIGQTKFHINANDHAHDMYRKMVVAGKRLINNYLPQIINNKNFVGKIQDDSRASFFKKPTYKDNEIFLSDSLDVMFKKIKAFSKPYLGAFIRKNGKKLVIWKAELYEEKQK